MAKDVPIRATRARVINDLRIRLTTPQQLGQSRIARTADRQFRAVPEDRHAAVLCVKLNPRDAFDVQQIRSMNTNEARRIEEALDCGKRLILEIRLALRMERDVIVLRLDVIDLVDGQHMDPRTV